MTHNAAWVGSSSRRECLALKRFNGQGATLVTGLVFLSAIIIALFVAYTLLHYVLFLLVSRPKEASGIGHELNQFERRQLVEWQPKKEDFLKHDDEDRTYDDVFGPYRSGLTITARVSFLACHSRIATRPTICC